MSVIGGGQDAFIECENNLFLLTGGTWKNVFLLFFSWEMSLLLLLLFIRRCRRFREMFYIFILLFVPFSCPHLVEFQIADDETCKNAKNASKNFWLSRFLRLKKQSDFAVAATTKNIEETNDRNEKEETKFKASSSLSDGSIRSREKIVNSFLILFLMGFSQRVRSHSKNDFFLLTFNFNKVILTNSD